MSANYGDDAAARLAQLEARVASLEQRLNALEYGGAAAVSLPGQGPTPAWPDAATAEIQRLVQAGNKIAAIKVYRQQYRVGLKEAKDAVDRMSDLR